MERSKRLIALSCCAALAFSACPVTAKAMVTADCADEYGEVISGGDYNIMVRLSGKFVTAGSDGNVQQWEKKGDSSQIWHIESAGDGKCCILSGTDRRMALTVENGDNTNGNNIYLSEYRDTAAQHFILHRTDDAYYITGECSGNAALDVYDISHENGANIDQWDYWAGEGQKFYIRPVGGEYSFIRGDLNFDSAVDIFDRVIMQRGIINGFDETMSVIADADGNGMVNTADLVLLSGFIAGKDVTM